MKNLVLRACCCLAGLTAAARLSDSSNRSIGNLQYVQLMPRTDSRPPSPEKPGSSSSPKSPAAASSNKIGDLIRSSVRQRFPSQGDGSEVSTSQVLRKPSKAQPLGNFGTLEPSVMRKQAVQIPSKSLEFPTSSKASRSSQRVKRIFTPGPSKPFASSTPARSKLTNAISPDQMTGLVRGKYTALAVANGPAYLEGGVLGKPSTGKVILPGRTGVLSIAHEHDTVWAVGNVGKGASAIAAATGDGLTTQVLAGYEGKGYIKTWGPQGHETHTHVAPGKKEEEQWEAIDPSKANLSAIVGIEGPGQATAGGLSLKHTNAGRDYDPAKSS